jgi:hypothetical protein
VFKQLVKCALVIKINSGKMTIGLSLIFFNILYYTTMSIEIIAAVFTCPSAYSALICVERFSDEWTLALAYFTVCISGIDGRIDCNNDSYCWYHAKDQYHGN